MPEIAAVGLEAAAAALALLAAFTLAGYGLTRLLAPPELRSLGVLLVPLVGAAALIVGSYVLNLVMDMRMATAVLLGLAAGLGAWSVRRSGWWLPRPTRPQTLALLAGGLLLGAAFLPHLHARSGAMLGLNSDEDVYVALAEALKWDTVFMQGLAVGPFQFEYQGLANHARGWGFPYLLAIGSILSNTPSFHAYAPLLYVLLALSVPSVFVFARAGLLLSERRSALAAVLYALHGLPLWFVQMGFGPHAASFALFPVAAATGLLALRGGGGRPLGLASLTSAALLVSYFWAISAVYLVVAVTLVAVLTAWGPARAATLRRALTLGGGTVLLGAPGIAWLVPFALPQLGRITSDLDGSFGNAWGDTQFVDVELAFGLQAYRLIPRDGPFETLLGPEGLAALNAVLGALFWPALALALLGLVTLRGDRRAALAMAGAFAGFMWWVAAGAEYHYGHFKNQSYVAFLVATLLASGIANLYHGRFALWSEASSRWLNERLAVYEPALRRAAAVPTLVLGAALLYNTYLSVWWNWQGAGWNVERRIAHDARATADLIPVGARVFFAKNLTYPVPDERRRLSRHVLGFHYPAHQEQAWAVRTLGVYAGMLVGRDVYAFTGSLAYGYDEQGDLTYDYLVLNSGDDPRTYGLLASDAVHASPYWTVYRDAPGQRLTANDLGAALGSLRVPADRSLQFGLRDGRLAVGPETAPAGASIMIGVAAAAPGELLADGARIPIEPGLTWLTLPPARGAAATVRASGGFQPQLAAARLLPASASVDAPLTDHTARHVVSVDVDLRGEGFSGVIITANPSGTGGNVGLSYQESPRQGAPASHGFWPSAAHVTMPAQRIEFDYDLRQRTITETIDGRVFPPLTAREAELHGDYRVSFEGWRGFIVDLSFPLANVHVRDGEVSSAQLFRQTYVFDMPSR